MNSKDRKKAPPEQKEELPCAIYYYCPHCEESHDPVNGTEKEGEIKCPLCGEIYKNK